jgi:hypothetical protein
MERGKDGFDQEKVEAFVQLIFSSEQLRHKEKITCRVMQREFRHVAACADVGIGWGSGNRGLGTRERLANARICPHIPADCISPMLSRCGDARKRIFPPCAHELSDCHLIQLFLQHSGRVKV